MRRLILASTIIALFLMAGATLHAQEVPLPNDTMSVVDTYGRPGDTVTVYLYFGNHTVSISGYSARLVFNPAVLQALSAQCYDRGCALDATSGQVPQDSVLKIVAYTLRPGYWIGRGSGPVAALRFVVKPTAQPGTQTTLRFVDNRPDIINAWADTTGSGVLYIPRLVNGNFSVLGGTTNQPPVIGNIGTQEIPEGQTLAFQVRAHDLDGDPITLSALNLPANSSFPTVQHDSSVTGTFTFSPDFTQGPNTFVVTFRAVDDHNNTTDLPVSIVVLDQPNDILRVESTQGGVPGAVGRDVNLSLSNTRNIYGLQFDYKFDPNRIEVTDVIPTDRCLNLGFWYNSPDPGRIVVLIFSPGLDPVLPGNGPLVLFRTNVSNSAAFGRTAVDIDSCFEAIDSIGTSRELMTESGYFTVDRFGDANLDEFINVGDCVSIVAFIVDRMSLNIRQFDAADINRDTRVNVSDLQAIIDYILEVQVTPPIMPPGPLVTVQLLRNVVPSGDMLRVPLWADVGYEAAAVQFQVTYNTDHLEGVDIEPGAMVAGMQLDHHIVDGKVRGVIYNLGGSSFGPTSGEMANLTFRVKAPDYNPARDLSLTEFLIVDPSASLIESEIKGELPDRYLLSQNYPNPFNLSTNISFDLPGDGNVELVIYDIMGRKVTTLLSSFLPAGSHTVTWNGRSDAGEIMSSGIFFYRLRTSDFDETRKMLLVK